ncbi:Long chain acyl-CoA synthetase/AMP-acid ligase II [Planoprotostelium fungivorum]|uniref:Long chain acyl-CoA synthetase/AMP-acid ligase II n=1 Tax=Planoprotostelium fungivorum TaxID=1890364 RepID=A0A2P6N595_9EUKA|nr:Long chain acyl-CoA synthetase/AMP-acid ligase II [Planoprotostelium fungivorum]
MVAAVCKRHLADEVTFRTGRYSCDIFTCQLDHWVFGPSRRIAEKRKAAHNSTFTISLSYRSQPQTTTPEMTALSPDALFKQCSSNLQRYDQWVNQSDANERVWLNYYGKTISYGESNVYTDKIAAHFAQHGVKKGDRVALFLQNVPEFLLSIIAAWKLGAIIVSVSPMYKERELTHIINDSGSKILITFEGAFADIALNAWKDCPTLQHLIVTHPADLLPADRSDFPELELLLKQFSRKPVGQVPSGKSAATYASILASSPKSVPPRVPLSLDDAAFLTYTSGTTGPAKGAINSHGNVVYQGHVSEVFWQMNRDSGIITFAPLFHITGLVSLGCCSIYLGCPLILNLQFHPSLIGRLVQKFKPYFGAGAITIFTALLNDKVALKCDFSSLTRCVSGGAPISVTIVEQFKKSFGIQIYTAYGMTETTAPSHFAPLGSAPPFNSEYNAISCGKSLPHSKCLVVDEDGKELPDGQIGELVTFGPQVVKGYWKNEAETKKAFTADGGIRTGDVGVRDKEGWYYIVDRKKDMIIASGFKIWPREVEDVIMTHPSVRETAVVGVPDEYRGETVKAYVSLKPNATLTPTELIEHCKKQMAAYKVVEIVQEVPKNLAGKILRREVRQMAVEESKKVKAKL